MALSVQFDRTLFSGLPASGSVIKMSPVSNPAVSGSCLAGAEPILQTCDANGITTFSGSFANTYKVEYLGIKGAKLAKETIFFITVPDGNGNINAKDYLLTTYTNTNTSSFAYTKTASDSLFIAKNNLISQVTGSGVTITPITQGAIQTITISANAGGLSTGSLYPITASWAITSSYALNATATGGGSNLITGSTVPITASVSLVAIAGGTQLATGSLVPITASQALTASYVGSGVPGNVPVWVSGSKLSTTSSIFQQNNSPFVGINTTTPGAWLDVHSSNTNQVIAQITSPSGEIIHFGQNQFGGGPFIAVNNNSAANSITLQGAGDATFQNPGSVVLQPATNIQLLAPVSSSFPISASLNGTASWAKNSTIAVTSSYADTLTAIHVSALGIADDVGGLFSFDGDSFQFGANTITGDTNGNMSIQGQLQLSSSIPNRVIATDASNNLTASGITINSTGDTLTGLFTGSHFGTSSWASNILTASFANIAGTLTNGVWSILPNGSTSLTIRNNGNTIDAIDQNGGITGSFYGTASVATTSLTATSASYSTFAQKFPAALPTGSTQNITSSWAVNVVNGGGSSLITGSTVPITSSVALVSISSSYATFAQTFPAVLTSGSTYNITSSWATNLVGGASGTSLFTGSTYQITASWANNSVSSSFAQTASYLSSPQRYIFQTTGSGLVGGITASFSESVCWIPIGVANKSYAVTCSNMPTNNQDYGSMLLVLDQTSTTNSGSAFTWPANFQWLGTGGKTNSPTFFTGSCRAKVFLECYVSGSVQNIIGTPII